MHRKCESSHINSDTTKILSGIFDGHKESLFGEVVNEMQNFKTQNELITVALNNLDVYSLPRSTDIVRILGDK